MALQKHDLAILTARFGVARFGATRFGFIPCPEDVMGTGTDEPGEYVWKEETPASQDVETDWTLQTEDCACRDLCTLALGTITPQGTPLANQTATIEVSLTGVLGLVEGVHHVDWGDGGHTFGEDDLLENGTLSFDHVYHAAGVYTVTLTLTDERGCTVTATGQVTVGEAINVSVEADPGETAIEGEAPVDFTYTVTGGTAPYTYSLAWTGGGGGGPNTDENPTITFTGTPLDVEIIPFVLTVTDADSNVAEYEGTVEVTYHDAP